jgi:hypothetical protein
MKNKLYRYDYWNLIKLFGGFMILFISAFVQAQTDELKISTNPTIKATCGQCNGRAALNVGDSEINKAYDKKEIKITLKNKQGEFSVSSTFGEKSRNYYFDNICEGDYVVTLERIDSRFTGLACAKKEYPKKMTAEGEGNFTVDLVSISNEIIQVSSTAKNPTYKWSNGTPGNFVQAQANTSYFVTVTDEVGCTKVGGPYKLPDGCGEGLQYNFEPSVAGPKMYTTPGQVLRA